MGSDPKRLGTESAQEERAALAAQTLATYERHAARFDAERTKGLHERPWLERFLSLVRPEGRVLDVGCGAGDPIAAFIASRGHPVTGVDGAAAMLALARARVPDGDWRRADMRTLDLRERFAGILAWNSFFHLTRAEQRLTLPRLAAHLEPGGPLMLTVGPRDGEAVGSAGGDPLYHASLSEAEYRSVLDRLGLETCAFVPEDPDCAGQTVLLARARNAR